MITGHPRKSLRISEHEVWQTPTLKPSAFIKEVTVVISVAENVLIWGDSHLEPYPLMPGLTQRWGFLPSAYITFQMLSLSASLSLHAIRTDWSTNGPNYAHLSLTRTIKNDHK